MNASDNTPVVRRVVLFGVAVVILFLLLLLFTLRLNQVLPGDRFARLMNMGKNYLEQGDAEKAIATYQEAVTLDTANTDARLNLANAFLLGGQSENAILLADEVLGLDRNSAAAHYIMGCAHLRLRKFEAALQAFQQSQTIDPAVTALNFQLSLAHEALGHAEEAVGELQTVIQFEPEHPAAHYRLSQLLLRAGKTDEAKQALERHRQILAKKPSPLATGATYERCKHTEGRVPFKLAQPEPKGVKVLFADATAPAFGPAAKYQGPVGVIDFNHDGHNSLLVVEDGKGFRVLANSNGVFRPRGEWLPAIAGAGYRKTLVGDLQNDRVEDMIVLGEKASHVFKFNTNGVATEVTSFCGLKDVTGIDGALADFDFTGKLDLLVVLPGDQGLRVFRNLGNMFFTDHTAASGVPAASRGARQAVLEDWNNDDLQDVFLARPGQPLQWLAKQRGGPLAATNSPADWPAAIAIATGDLNNDLRADLVVAAPDKLVCIFGGLKEQTSIPLKDFAVTSLNLVDYDNDGWLDIVAGGNRLRVWRNLGQAGFQEMTRELGLDKLATGKIESIAAADFDQDGDTDLLLSATGKGLQLLRNDGGNANHQLKLRLLGNRSNASGLGVRVEVTAANWRTSRTVQRLPLEIGVGQHRQLDAITARWFDLSLSQVDVKIEPRAVLDLVELQLPTGSCPYLYAWDGNRFRFVTDLLGAAPLGLRLADDRFVDADPEEFVRLGNEEAFQPRDGLYVLQITEELREVLYLDEAKLVVVDHPADTEVHTTGKLRPGKPFPSHEIVTLHQRRPLARAVRSDGVDVTAALAETDGQFVSPITLRIPQLRGLAEPYSVTLDFGLLDVERPLVLALTGWLRFGGGMANVAASHDPDLPFPFPQLEVETVDGSPSELRSAGGAKTSERPLSPSLSPAGSGGEGARSVAALVTARTLSQPVATLSPPGGEREGRGDPLAPFRGVSRAEPPGNSRSQWQPVDVVAGAPAGKTKTILIDLTGKLPPGSRRLKLSTGFEIHWDRIALFEKRDNSETRLTTLSAESANLHRRGYSEHENLPWYLPLTPQYEQVKPFADWRITPTGWCTRYGEIGELIGLRDNALALLNGGDELTLKFAVGKLPLKPAGSVRDFFLHSVGWDKDADFHCELGWQVDPLPWHGMDDPLYGKQLRPTFSSDELMKRYNTRWVGPYTVARGR